MKKLLITTVALYALSVNILLASSTEATSNGGMPQLDFTTFPKQIFWFIIIFIALYVFISKYTVPKIKSIKASRERLINQNYSNNEKNIAEIEKIKKIISLQLKDTEENSRNIIKKLTKELLEIEEKRINEVKAQNDKLKIIAANEITNIDKDFFNNFKESLNEIVTITLDRLNIKLPKEVVTEQIKESISFKKDNNNA